MNAVLFDNFGNSDVLWLGRAKRPVPAKGQVLIRVMATSVNGPDIVQRKGKYPPPKGDSEILGVEVAGVIEEAGPGVTGWQAGQRVMCLVGGGGYAEYAVAWASHLIPIPDNMGYDEAACVCEAYIVAFFNLFMLAGLVRGETVLLHGGGGGVNTAALQLVKALAPECPVIVTASSAKLGRVQELGADLVIDYRARDFAEAVRTFTGKRGVDVILDHIGADYLSSNMNALAYGGRLVIIGVNSGIRAELNLGLMMVKRQTILGSVMRSRSIDEKAQIIAKFTETVMPLFAARELVPVIHKVFPLADVKKAHTAMEESRHFGKIVLDIAIPEEPVKE